MGLYSLVTSSQILNAHNNDSLSNFKAERLAHRFQLLFLRLYFSLDIHYYCRQLFFAFLAGFGVYVMRFSLSVSIGWRIAPLIQVVVYHRHTARAGFATFGLVRLEIGREGIYPCPFFTAMSSASCNNKWVFLTMLSEISVPCCLSGCTRPFFFTLL